MPFENPAINLHGGDESDLKHRQETFRKHFGSALEFEDPLPPFVEPERSPFDVDLCELPGLEMYLRTIFEAADTLPSVLKSTSELGYPEKYCVDLREPSRHRTDAVRRGHGDNVASMA